MIEKIKKYYSERSNSYEFGGEKHYRPIYVIGASLSFVTYALMYSMMFCILWIIFAIFGGGLTSDDLIPFNPRNVFWIISIGFGVLVGASKVFLQEIERYEKDEHFEFSTVRLSKEEARKRAVKQFIECHKNKHNRPNYSIEKNNRTIRELERKAKYRKQQLEDYPNYIYVLAGLSMFLIWVYKQITRWLGSVGMISLIIVVLIQLRGWKAKDIDYVKDLFNNGVLLVYSLLIMVLFFCIWVLKAQIRRQFIGGSSYFWKMLDNHKLKKHGILVNEMTNDVKIDELILFGNEITDDVKRDELMLKRLKLQQKSNRKRRART